MTYDKLIIIEKRDPQSGEFGYWRQFHARINKTGGGEREASGARRSAASLTFELRYVSLLFDIFLNTQDYRIIYRNAVFVINDYDDFMEQHKTVRLEGECVGERQDNY